MANLDLYNKVRAVPQEACKSFNNGSFSGTDISPMWRIKVLTEQFGVCGLGWYIDEVERWSETLEGETMVFCKIHLFVKDSETGEWSKPIVGIGGNKLVQQFSSKKKISDEGYKMAYTDAISVACKALGIGADVYWQNDPTKYAQYYTEQQAPVAQPAPQPQAPRGRKKAAPQSETPMPGAPAPQPQASLQSIQAALNEVAMVATTNDLMLVWNRWKGQFGKDAQFVKAVQSSPYHPNNVQK